MTEFELIVSLFPIIFMIHEFEEIIGVKAWVGKNGKSIAKKFPILEKQLDSYAQLSVPAFVIAVFEEFIIVGGVTVLALMLQWDSVWISVFMAFSIHVLVHIVQWIIVRKYIPVIITSFLSLPYIAWGISMIFEEYSISTTILYTVIGVIFMIVNLRFAQFLANYFNRQLTE